MSTTPICASDAGTNEPTCAINVISATCLIYVDFPAILGPVIIASLFWSVSKYVSFDTNSPDDNIFSITGCLPSLIFNIPSLLIVGLQ